MLIETIPAAFEMEEILYELREHSAGLNAGRWDYLFSIIKKFRTRGKEFVLPERNSVTMTAPFMRAYTELLVKTCHRRGAHAIGGMAAFIPSRRDPEVNEKAMAKVREDKTRESGDGFDGSWVAHPDLVPLCKEVFDGVLGANPNQLARQREDVHVTAEDLLAVSKTPGTITEAGLRNNISVALQYLASWLGGNGAVGIFNLMEDAATAEISRSQIWQWIHNDVALDDGDVVTRDLVERLIDEELSKIRATTGAELRRRAVRPGGRAVHRGRAGRQLRRVPDHPGVRADAVAGFLFAGTGKGDNQHRAIGGRERSQWQRPSRRWCPGCGTSAARATSSPIRWSCAPTSATG